MICDDFIKEQYQTACQTLSDINEHLPELFRNASEVHHVTEMGIREGVSTRAFLAARPDVYVGYDIHQPPQLIYNMMKFVGGDDYSIKLESSLEANIQPTDLLFIDTLHNHDQLLTELNRHHSKVSHRIILHDTVSFGRHDESGRGVGLLPALVEFISSQNHLWAIVKHFTNNNGLTILERIR